MSSHPSADRLFPLFFTLLVFASSCSENELLALDDLPPPRMEPGPTSEEPALDEEDLPPDIQITEPIIHGVYGTEFPVTLLARVDDREDSPEDLRIDWGFLDSGDLLVDDLVPVSTGDALATVWLEQGIYTLVATVTDSAGQTAVDSVTFQVADGDDPPVDPPEDPPTTPEDDECIMTISVLLDDELLLTGEHEIENLPEEVAPSVYINATEWWGRAGAEVDDLAVIEMDSGDELLSDDFSNSGNWSWSSGASGNCGVSDGMGYGNADWNALGLVDSVPLDRDLRYELAVRSSATTGRYLLDLLDATAGGLWIRVAFCPASDAMTCGGGAGLGLPTSLGWVVVDVDGTVNALSLPVSPIVNETWQILAMEVEFGEGCLL